LLVEIWNIAVFVCVILQIRPKAEIQQHFDQSPICKNGRFSAGDVAEIQCSPTCNLVIVWCLYWFLSPLPLNLFRGHVPDA